MNIFYIENIGYCHCCRKNSLFKSTESWLRDHYLCSNCLSIPRQRHLQYILDSQFKGWEKASIHESSPSNAFLSQYSRNYSSSQYFPNTKLGASKDGVRCENLESLTFSDSSFDIFITQDVFEHIFDPAKAAKEIARVLKAGGIHVFTAPKHKGISASYPRAALQSNGDIEYILEAQYHGNPIGDGKSLVTWDYGSNFEQLYTSWSDCSVTTYITQDRNLGLDGEFLEVFVARKSSIPRTRRKWWRPSWIATTAA